MVDIIESENGIWSLVEDGQNVLFRDCVCFGISKRERKSLFAILRETTDLLIEGGSLEPLMKKGVLKQLTRQLEAVRENLWEIRSDGKGARLVFVLQNPRTIIISAVDKGKGSLSQAVQRGVKRWKTFLKTERK